jgi:signal transduction histidine kinase/putative methionine-R-sulfoxide reductase with GAF domain
VTPYAHSVRRARAASSPTPVPAAEGVTETPQDSDALSHVARRLAAAGTDIGAARALLANNAVTLLAADGAVLARIEGDEFRVEAAAGSLTPMVGFHAPLADSLAAEAVARGHAIAVNDADTDARVEGHFLAPFAPRSVVVAPLVAGHESRGFLLVLNSRHGVFTAQDRSTLQRLADFGAIAVLQIADSRHAEAAAVDTAMLSGVVREINESLELERVVALVARHAARLTDARGARVMLVEAAGLSIVAAVGDASDAVGTTVDPARQFAQEAIEQLSGVRTPDLSPYADEWMRSNTSGDAANDRGRPNGLAVPLLVGGRAIGAIAVFGNESRDFDERDQSILQGLADHAAIAVENARLYRAAAYMARHANALAAAARSLAISTTPEAVMAGISRVACTALGADGFSVFLANPKTRRVDMAHSEGLGSTIINWTANRFWTMTAGEVTISGAPLYASDSECLYGELKPEEVATYRASRMRSIAFLPLPNDGGQQGVLILRFAVRHRFDEPERRLLDDFATQVAVAIRNAQLADAERASRDREGALKESMHQTEKLAALGELVAGVAHELNNPLTGISTFAQLLLEDDLSEEQRESAREIKREADRAVGVIRDLLAFSRKTGPRLVAVDLNALVHHTLRLRAYSLQSAGVEVRTEFDPMPPLAVGDDQRLQQVMLNLVVNAEYAVHRADRRTLTMRTGRRTTAGVDSVFVEVDDTGTGMTPEVLSHIFEPFFTTKPAGVGTGLGLSVSHTIVQAHGGQIDVRSAPGAGSTFTITLPAYTASSDRTALAETSPPPNTMRWPAAAGAHDPAAAVSPRTSGPTASAKPHAEGAPTRPLPPSSASMPHADQ